MNLFDKMLKADETLFRNAVVLDFDYVPKRVPYRESQQQAIISCIRPLFSERNGKNLLLTGIPGIGKTVACKHVLLDMEEQTDEIDASYVNCWKHNTSYKIFLEVCNVLGYRFTQNKKTEELFAEIKKLVNKRSAVFVFDEIDRADDRDFLYMLLEEIYRKSIILITNDKEWIVTVDDRIKSRLAAEVVEFLPYTESETRGILADRLEKAFYPDLWQEDAFLALVKKSFSLKDIRVGLKLLKEAGELAEDKSSRRVMMEHYLEAEKKLDEFFVKKEEELGPDERLILSVVKRHPSERIGELFKLCQSNGLSIAYKSFQRKIKKLEGSRFVSTEKIIGGAEGTTTLVRLKSAEGKREKKLSEF